MSKNAKGKLLVFSLFIVGLLGIFQLKSFLSSSSDVSGVNEFGHASFDSSADANGDSDSEGYKSTSDKTANSSVGSASENNGYKKFSTSEYRKIKRSKTREDKNPQPTHQEQQQALDELAKYRTKIATTEQVAQWKMAANQLSMDIRAEILANLQRMMDVLDSLKSEKDSMAVNELNIELRELKQEVLELSRENPGAVKFLATQLPASGKKENLLGHLQGLTSKKRQGASVEFDRKMINPNTTHHELGEAFKANLLEQTSEPKFDPLEEFSE